MSKGSRPYILPPMNRRWMGTLAGTLLAILAATLLATGGPLAGNAGAAKKRKATHAQAAPAAFCSNPIVDNYRAPLEKLQPMPAVPEGGALPFAAGMTVAATGPQGLLVGGSNIGFRLTDTAPEATPGKRLDWTVLERLIRLTDNGGRPHPAGLKRIDLAQLPAGKHRGLTFPIPDQPAVYSVEVTIQNHRGRLLGRYGEYIREVNRTVNTAITLAATDDVAPGSYLESCFENHGSAAVTPTGTSLERFDGTSWLPVVVGAQYSPAQTTIQRTLGPGEGERIGTLIPPNAKPGLYKLTATGSVADSGEPLTLAAEFGVL
jgi:hypothetical protein